MLGAHGYSVDIAVLYSNIFIHLSKLRHNNVPPTLSDHVLAGAPLTRTPHGMLNNTQTVADKIRTAKKKSQQQTDSIS